MKAYSEDLRIRVINDSDAGMTTKAVAAKYQVSESWLRLLKQLRRVTGSIKPIQRANVAALRKFPIAKLSELEAFLKEGAIAQGWASELWTIQRVMALIKSKYDIILSTTTVWNILTKHLKWSSIKPQTVLRERDEEKISNWQETGFNAIKRRAFKRGAYLVFVDEAGFMLQPTLRKTFAPRGSRPVIKVSDPHGRISTACAIAISPKLKRPSLYFRLLADNANFTGPSIASFLKYVHHKVRSPLTLICDSIPIHSAEPVRNYDGVWSYIKYGRLANFAPCDLITLRKQVTKELEDLSNKPQHLASFVAKCKLSLTD